MWQHTLGITHKIEKTYIFQNNNHTMSHFQKFILYFTGFLSIFALCLGCAKSERLLNSPVPYNYTLLLHFQDAFGTDILKEIPVQDSSSLGYFIVEDKDGWIGSVQSDLYKLEVVGIPELFFVPENNFKDVWYKLLINKLDGCHYLVFQTDSSPYHQLAEVITFKFTCPYIFNDTIEHNIVTYWDPDGLFIPSGISRRIECNRIEIDGIEWQVEQKIFIPNWREESKEIIAQYEGSDFSRIMSVARIVID